ncbi:MAG TPA: arginine--tRNA ligase [Ktedonobacterales bacterium]|nr:arginine--tRNA ligase [Ktedonobacterales bacterium]
MIRDLVADIITRSVAALQEADELPAVELPPFEVERPQLAVHGDYATNVAMKLAATVRASGGKVNPRALAETIATRIRETVAVVPAYDLIDRVEVAGPGFINLWLANDWLLRQTAGILAAGNTLGCIEQGHGQRVNVEFVSANPTGPVTVGNGRGAFTGDALSSVLSAAGYDVTKEYYFNNAGGQINRLGGSMEYYLLLAQGKKDEAEAVYAALPEVVKKQKRVYGQHDVAEADERGADDETTLHEDTVEEQSEAGPARKEGYFGPFYEALAERMIAAGDAALLDEPDEANRRAAIGRAASNHIIEDIKQTLERMRVEFDVWFNEASLGESGELEQGVADLRAAGHTYEKDGALWVQTTDFGDDRDRVVLRSNGLPTYFASDVAYMRNKFGRGFDRLIYVLGADHHGYIARLKSIAQSLGHPAESAHVVLTQQVTLKVDGKGVKMGKRLGNAVTLDELYEDIGPDVTRFFYLMRSNDTPLEFDLNLARKQTDENPGLSVQYAHARAAGVLRKASDLDITEEQYGDADVTVLAADPPDELTHELALIRQILRLEEVVERIAQTLEPHHLTRYGMDLADAFHLFYDHCPILKQGADISNEVRMARLRLLRAGQAGLARTLTLIGMSAPERMEREVPEA